MFEFMSGSQFHKIKSVRSVSAYWRLMSLTSGSNFGPPGTAIFKALEVKKALRSNR